MLSAKRLGKPLLPIFYHALMHSLLMYCFLHLVSVEPTQTLYVCLFQLITHFLIDTWKGRVNVWLPSLQDNTNKWHWVVFGFDQLLHTIVIILIVTYLK